MDCNWKHGIWDMLSIQVSHMKLHIPVSYTHLRGGNSVCGWAVTQLQVTREMWVTARMRLKKAKKPRADHIKM